MTRPSLLSSYSGQRVLVTGDTGFKGSWLSLWLHVLGARVTGYALPAERSDDHFETARIAELVEHVDGDIRDLQSLSRVVGETQPAVVFHLAAQALVRPSYEDPKRTFDTNVGGSTNVLEAVRKCASVRALVYVTSDKCYRNQEWIWGYRENDELGGHDPYSASKAAAELVFSSYVDSYFTARAGFGAASVRAGNVIGGGDWSKDRIVPDCISALRRSEPIRLRRPSAIRPWQHVLEPLRGYLRLAVRLMDEPNTYTGAWNFGPRPESTRSVSELATQIVAHWGNGEIVSEDDQTMLHESELLNLNCDKAHRVLQWYPVWDFDRTIRETVQWYRETNNGAMAREVSLRQIAAFSEEAPE